MADVSYHISASYIGAALENQNFFIYHTDCTDENNLVAIGGQVLIPSASLATGLTVVVDETVEKLYLVPLSEECPLGCGYDYYITLSDYVPPTPTPTNTLTPSPSTIPDPTPTPSITPSPSTPASPPPSGMYGIHSISRNGEQLRVVWSADDYFSYQRAIYAYNLASFLTNGNPPGQSISESSPITASLPMDFYVYKSDQVTIAADVVRLPGAHIYYFSDSNQTTLVVNTVSVGTFSSGKQNYYYLDKLDA